MNKKSFLTILKELQLDGAVAEPVEPTEEETLLTEEMDHEILMHRDAHFGGDFQVMLAYYGEDRVGINPNLDIERICYLAEVEKEMGKDLAPFMLSAPEAERVAKARRAYEGLKEIYSIEETKNPLPKLIADLIMSEEDEPLEQIDAVVSCGSRIVPELVELIACDDFYDTLFPGYGLAPSLAIYCLGKIKDPSTVAPIFEQLRRDLYFEEEVILSALAEIGEPAKEFLLKLLKSRPLNEDNSHAAFALCCFAEDPEVGKEALAQLENPEVHSRFLLATYLLGPCEALQSPKERERFKKMAQSTEIPVDLREEMNLIIGDWHE